jgi:hypothetical protein
MEEEDWLVRHMAGTRGYTTCGCIFCKCPPGKPGCFTFGFEPPPLVWEDEPADREKENG